MIRPSDPEYQLLINAGVDEKDIQEGAIKRGDLLKAGFVFYNRIGGGEKPLINVEHNGINFADLKLLTMEQFDMVKQLEQETVSKLPEGITMEDIREDMLSFLLSAGDPRPFNLNGRFNTLRHARNNVLGNHTLSGLDKTLVNKYMEFLRNQKPNFQAELDFMREHCADVYPWTTDNDTLNQEHRDIRFTKVFRAGAVENSP